MYEILSPIGTRHKPAAGSCWKIIESVYQKLLEDSREYFGKNGDAIPSQKQFLNDIEGIVPWTWWPHEEVGHTDEAKREGHALIFSRRCFWNTKARKIGLCVFSSIPRS